MPAPDHNGPASGRRPGRPRDHSRTRIILETTTSIVTEVGFDRLRVQDVAEQAGVSLATIYRRWPTKTALVADAIRRDPSALLDLEDGDEPPGVEAVLRAIATRLHSARGARMAVLAVEIDEPEILAAVRETHLPPVRQLMRSALERVPGLDPADLDDPADLARRIHALLEH